MSSLSSLSLHHRGWGKRYPSFLKTKKSLGVYGLDNGGEATLASRLVLWAQQNDRCGSIINTQLWGLTLASEFVSLQTASLGLPMPVWSGSTSLKEIAHVLEPWAEHLDKMAQKLSA